MTESRTHLSIDSELVGIPTLIEEGKAVCTLTTTVRMAADSHGLVHGGFVFGLADYAAMLAVNDPNVVLGSSEVTFVKPVSVGKLLEATAVVVEGAGKKRLVDVSVVVDGDEVCRGKFVCFVLSSHVLSRS